MPSKSGPRRTANQREVMGIILYAANNGKTLRSIEIYDEWSGKTKHTYGALRKVLEVLEDKGMIVRERDQKDGRNVSIIPTQLGYDWFRPKT